MKARITFVCSREKVLIEKRPMDGEKDEFYWGIYCKNV